MSEHSSPGNSKALKRNEVLCFDDGLLTIKMSGHGSANGWATLSFNEQQFELNDEGHQVVEIPPSELYELRDFLNRVLTERPGDTAIHAQGAMPPTNCDWPDTPFTFLDEPGEHDPCYVVMPGGAMLSLNHHATPGVDIARAKFIVDACNAALSPDFPRAAVAEAMQDAWNTICADTGCHPLDIKHRGKQLFFKPGHWVDLIALFLSRGDPSVSSTERHCEFCHVPMSSADCCDSEFESKGCPHSSPERS